MSNLDIYCLLRPFWPNNSGKYGRQKEYLLQLNVFERWQCLNLWSHTFNFYHSLGKFRRQQIDILLIFSRKQAYKFHVNFLSWRQFVWNVKTCFLGKIRKIFQASICWNIYPAYYQRRQTDKKNKKSSLFYLFTNYYEHKSKYITIYNTTAWIQSKICVG